MIVVVWCWWWRCGVLCDDVVLSFVVWCRCCWYSVTDGGVVLSVVAGCCRPWCGVVVARCAVVLEVGGVVGGGVVLSMVV